ncbi:hypothetical protein CR513_26978, partial [Mucuna pruriens]
MGDAGPARYIVWISNGPKGSEERWQLVYFWTSFNTNNLSNILEFLWIVAGGIDVDVGLIPLKHCIHPSSPFAHWAIRRDCKTQNVALQASSFFYFSKLVSYDIWLERWRAFGNVTQEQGIQGKNCYGWRKLSLPPIVLIRPTSTSCSSIRSIIWDKAQYSVVNNCKLNQ